MTISLTINDKKVEVDADPATPLLWVLRDHLGMTGTKYGCGIAQCGACTIHIDGQPVRSCQYPLEAAAGHFPTRVLHRGVNARCLLGAAWDGVGAERKIMAAPSQFQTG